MSSVVGRESFAFVMLCLFMLTTSKLLTDLNKHIETLVLDSILYFIVPFSNFCVDLVLRDYVHIHVT